MLGYDDNPSPYLRLSVADHPYRLLEWTTFLRTLGSVEGQSVIDLACGDGRVSRVLAHNGARHVVGVDISRTMIQRAEEQNRPGNPEAFPDTIEYRLASVSDEAFQLADPADVAAAMYLFHYAESVDELGRMGRFIARNLRPGGRFVGYTINPDYDFRRQPADMEDSVGFRYRIVAPPAYALQIGQFSLPIWQWSRAEHETALLAAGLTDVVWHALTLPAERADLADRFAWYLQNPSLIVISARKPG